MNGAARSRPLAPALSGWAEVPAELTVGDLVLDSRAVAAGDAFVACRGRERHGLQYAPDAVQRGARVILWEPEGAVRPPALAADIVLCAVPRLRERLGDLADRFYGSPSRQLWIAGVTGTNGKTTCAWLLAQALGLLGRRSAYLGTLGVGLPGALRPLGHTTPDTLSLHRSLAELVAMGVDSLAMEVSSHALDQQRCAGVRMQSAAFTNLTQDHLDYHGDMRAYGAAKARLLAWPGLTRRVINIDDAFGRSLAQRAGASLIVTSRQDPERARVPSGAEYVCARAVTITRAGLTLELVSSRGAGRIVSLLRGPFNVDNLLTVLALLLSAGVPLASACAALEHCRPPPGRMQPEGGGEQPLVLIDYAHTPDALGKALAAARLHCAGRLWCVFGCGGERDRGKRAQMGRVAAEGADELIVTDDNPRGEDPAGIVAEILRGIDAAGAQQRTRVIHERGEAIGAALAGAAAGDVVLVAGKGHEDYQQIGSERRAFSDTARVREALAQRSLA
jgi:UDP-N-acetylmuramoyl-L-alanyl-D-glutamate--2,6-diaminopimelate ligase